jgi:LiaF transmembrane domain
MNDQNQHPNSDPNTPPTYHDWREQRHAERMARREARWQRRAGRPHGLIGGMILILLGIVFLLQNLGIPFLMNWWALFILIPAFWSYVAAWNFYQDNGRMTRSVAGSLTAGILLTGLSLVFLLNMTVVNLFWPALLIVGGLALLATGLMPE